MVESTNCPYYFLGDDRLDHSNVWAIWRLQACAAPYAGKHGEVHVKQAGNHRNLLCLVATVVYAGSATTDVVCRWPLNSDGRVGCVVATMWAVRRGTQFYSEVWWTADVMPAVNQQKWRAWAESACRPLTQENQGPGSFRTVVHLDSLCDAHHWPLLRLVHGSSMSTNRRRERTSKHVGKEMYQLGVWRQ